MSTQKAGPRAAGPWSHRMLVWIFTIVLGVLIYWLIGFVMQDLNQLSGPDYVKLRETRIDPKLLADTAALERDYQANSLQIETERARQEMLRKTTDNAQTTMNQLLEFQKLNLEKGATPSEQERQALAESEQLFLNAQREYQTINVKLAELLEQQRNLQAQQRAKEEELRVATLPVDEEFERLQHAHLTRITLLKLAILLPLIGVALFVYFRYRSGAYWALVYAFGTAVILRVFVVMHEYERKYFKYILISTLLLVSLRVLIYLLRLVAHPRSDWLNKQYREAYEAFLCPVCAHPIRRGPLRYLSWTRRSIHKLSIQATVVGATEEAYTCPACCTPLYEVCTGCGGIRHSLLPACEHCGLEKPIVAS